MEPHTSPDMAGEIDQPEEILAEVLRVDLATARRVLAYYEQRDDREKKEMVADIIARIVGQLCRPGVNQRAMVYALALAAGLGSLNEVSSQSEVARRLGCTRALISHYVCAWADLLGLHIAKFRKRNSSRDTYRETAVGGWQTRKDKKNK